MLISYNNPEDRIDCDNIKHLIIGNCETQQLQVLYTQ